jgi:hypothetical protein
MKLGDKHYSETYGKGYITRIDESGYIVKYNNRSVHYEHKNIEKRMFILMSIITLLFWCLVFGLIYWVW